MGDCGPSLANDAGAIAVGCIGIRGFLNELQCRELQALELPTSATISPQRIIVCGTTDPSDSRLADTDSHATIAPLPADPLSTIAPDSSLSPSSHSSGVTAGTRNLAPAAAGVSRYQVVRFHAKGGLGYVSVARDQELNRDVALKEIQPQFADDLNSRAKFILEAEVTGGLEHPGIVPIYGWGVTPMANHTTPCGLSEEPVLPMRLTAFIRKPNRVNCQRHSARFSCEVCCSDLSPSAKLSSTHIAEA